MSEFSRAVAFTGVALAAAITTGCASEVSPERPRVPSVTVSPEGLPSATASAESLPSGSLLPSESSEGSEQARVTGKAFQLIGNNACKIISIDGTRATADANPAPEPNLRTIKITFGAARDPKAAAQEDALNPNGTHLVSEVIDTYYIADPTNIVDVPRVDSKYDVTDFAPYQQDRTKPERPLLSVFVPETAEDGDQVVVAQTVREHTPSATLSVMRGCAGLAEYNAQADAWVLETTTPATVTDPTCKYGPPDKNKLPESAIVDCNQ